MRVTKVLTRYTSTKNTNRKYNENYYNDYIDYGRDNHVLGTMCTAYMSTSNIVTHKSRYMFLMR